MNTEAIILRDLGIGYTTKHGVITVAEDINGTICSRELTCLLGANGVGKSTLLRTLSAFQPKIQGEIMIGGRDLSDWTDKELSRLIGVVLTEKPDVRNMTVRELVSLGRSPYTGFWGTYSKEDLQIVDEAISLVGIDLLSRRMVHTLSDGERQKVMIAKALAQQTPVIYLDEPTAFLDYPSKVEVLQLLRRISREAGKDVVWLMTRGEQMAIGSPKTLAKQGDLGRFIEREGISFDPETLTIRVKRND